LPLQRDQRIGNFATAQPDDPGLAEKTLAIDAELKRRRMQAMSSK